MKKITNLVFQVKYAIGDEVKVIPFEDELTYDAVIIGIDAEFRVGQKNVYYVVDINGREVSIIESEIVS